MPFQPGQSGNAAGRPRGARNKATVLIEQLLDDDAESIIRAVIAQAKAGNTSTLLLLARSLLPKRKDAPVEIDLPPLEQAADGSTVIAAIIAHVCAGEITPGEGTSLTRMVEAFVRAKQKTGEVSRRPEDEKAAAVAAADQLERVATEDKDQPQSGSVAPPPTVPQEGVELPIPDGLRTSLPASAGRKLRRLREHALSATSPGAQRHAASTAIVFPLFCADAGPPGAESLAAAA